MEAIRVYELAKDGQKGLLCSATQNIALKNNGGIFCWCANVCKRARRECL
jgi:hypothetical protein